MSGMTRLILAVAVLVIGVVASTSVSQFNDRICFYQVSCGDRMLPCVCLPEEHPRCRLCTGTVIGNFCFECPEQTCLALMEVYCGNEYKGVCLADCFPCPRRCAAMTLVGACSAASCQ